MANKRNFPRLDEIWDVDYRTVTTKEFKSDPINSITMNISGGGICFEAGEEIPEGTMLVLELKSPIFPSSIIALAKTCWCTKKKKDKYNLGAKFWWTGWKDDSVQKKVAKYINKKIT